MHDPETPTVTIQVLKVHPLYITAIVHGQRWIFPNWAAVLRAAGRPAAELDRQRRILEKGKGRRRP